MPAERHPAGGDDDGDAEPEDPRQSVDRPLADCSVRGSTRASRALSLDVRPTSTRTFSGCSVSWWLAVGGRTCVVVNGNGCCVLTGGPGRQWRKSPWRSRCGGNRCREAIAAACSPTATAAASSPTAMPAISISRNCHRTGRCGPLRPRGGQHESPGLVGIGRGGSRSRGGVAGHTAVRRPAAAPGAPPRAARVGPSRTPFSRARRPTDRGSAA